MSIYQFDDYRELIESLLQQKIGRGARKLLAEELNCQPGYISQVLNKSKIHFSQENLIKVALFLELEADEQEYVLNLLHMERSGSKELRTFYSQKVKKAQSENLRVEKQIGDISQELSPESEAIYYSHWAYSAIHLIVSVGGFKRSEQIAQRLKLSPELVRKILKFLEEKKLITKAEGQYHIGKTRIHLKKDSPLVRAHHQNFRNKAILSLDEENDFDLHYSSVLTLSKKDSLKVRDLLLKLLSDKEKILIPSPNEEMICLNFDLFRL